MSLLMQSLHVSAAALPGASVVCGPVPNDGSLVSQHCRRQCSGPHVHAACLPHGRLCHHEAECAAMGGLDVLVLPYAGNTFLSGIIM